MTMIELNSRQRAVLADKLPDAANVAAAALVFGQVLGERTFSYWLAACGLALWIFFFSCAIVLAAGNES